MGKDFITGEEVLEELGRIHALVKSQRLRVEKQAKLHAKTMRGKGADANHTPRDLTIALEKLVLMMQKLSAEYRQLKKALDAEEMTDEEAFEALIAAGWIPPEEN